MYSIRHYEIKFVSDLQQVGGFLRGTPVSSTKKTDSHDVTEILLKVTLHTINQPTIISLLSFVRLAVDPTNVNIYSYKYLESDLIKHCHMIFIHSLGQPVIIRSHSKVHRSRGNPKEIPT